MNCCDPKTAEYTHVFGTKKALKQMKSYKKRGPSKSTRKLLSRITDIEGNELSEKTLLDIGSGICSISFELFPKGLKSAACIDISNAYINEVRKEAEKKGWQSRIKLVTGDIVAESNNIHEADIVTLDKTICCYGDYRSLVETSTKKARKFYGVIVPRDVWWVKAVNGIGNFFRKLSGDSFRTYVHPVGHLKELIAGSGFKEVYADTAMEWQILAYVHDS